MRAEDDVISVGGFPVANLTVGALVSRIASEVDSDRPFLAFALHVGGLVEARRKPYRDSMLASDLIYADGMSVLVVGWAAARRSGQRFLMQRAPTTDIGWAVIDALSDRLGRPARVALIGGVPGLAEETAAVMLARSRVMPVMATHGFHASWPVVLQEVRASRPDIVFVGLGVPLEQIWCAEWRDALPPSVIMTCGGWFSFVTGREHRSPRIMQALGLEWLFRLVQNPRRLLGRYLRGAIVTTNWFLTELRGRRNG